MLPVRINPSMLAVARNDDLGRIAAPMLFAGVGTAAGIMAASKLKTTPTKGALIGAALGVAAYLGAQAIDKRR